MKIALISIHYTPLNTSCAVQMRDMARALLSQGHEPLVIVPSNDLKNSYKTEIIDGIKVFRLKTFGATDIGYIWRGISEIVMSFTILSSIRKSGFPMKDLDGVVWYSPSIFFGPIVNLLKRKSNCPTYLILRDIFPEWALDLGILRKTPIYYLLKLIAKYQYSVANIIGVQTSSNLKYLESWSKNSNRKLEVLNNWLSTPNIKRTDISIINSKLSGRKIFVYIGNMGIAQGMDVLISLAESLQERKDIGFIFVGRGSELERLKKYSSDKKLNNILFYEEVSSEEIPDLLSMCHVGLIALDSRHKSHNIPGKFLSYMHAGLPVLAKVNAGTDLINLIQDENVGYVYTGNKINDLRGLAEDLISNEKNLLDMSKQAKTLMRKRFSSISAAEQIISSLLNFR